MRHSLPHLLVALLCLFLVSIGYTQQVEDCPVPLVSTADDTQLVQVFYTSEYIIYQARQEASQPFDALYSIPIDRNAPPTQLYQHDEYMTVLSFEDNIILVDLSDGQLVEVRLGADAVPIVMTVFEHEQPVGFFTLNDDIGYIVEDSDSAALYSLDQATYTPLLITDQIAVEDMQSKRYRVTDDYLVYFGRDEDGQVGIYSHSLKTGEVTLLSNDLRVAHGIRGGTDYVFFVIDRNVIFEVHNNADQAAVYSVPIAGGEPILLTTSVNQFGFGGEIALSRDKSHLVYKDGGALFSVPTDGGEPPHLVATLNFVADSFTLSPEEEFIFYTAEDRLHRATLSGAGIDVFDPDTMIRTNFTVQRVRDTYLVTTATPNSSHITAYLQPADLGASMQILFQSVWDYQYGSHILPAGDDAIFYREYDGEMTRIVHQQIGDMNTSSVQFNCMAEGHVRFIDVIDRNVPMLVYTVNNHELYTLEITP